MFDKVLDRFLQFSPAAVLGSLVVQRALDPAWLNEVFHQHRDRTYEKELLFSSIIDLTAHVVLGLQPSLHAAFKNTPPNATFQAVYGKVGRTEPSVLRAMVAGSYQRLAPVVAALGPRRPPLVPGHRVRILDGNDLPASEKRLKMFRGFRGAAMPGQSLVIYDRDLDLIADCLPCEDAYTHERTLMAQRLASVQAGDIEVADRAFSTRPIFWGYRQRRAYLVVREHATNPNPTAVGRRRYRGRCETGKVYVQQVEIPGEKPGDKPMRLRRVEVHLDLPTQDGDTVVRILTNVPKRLLDAVAVAELYRQRWTIEGMFQRLEASLHSEVQSLGIPAAALLAFSTACVAFNTLSVVQASIEAAHPICAEQPLSMYYLALELRNAFSGLRIALPPEFWEQYAEQRPTQMAATLRQVAARVRVEQFTKALGRKPKEPKRKGYVDKAQVHRHVSTARARAAGTVDYDSG